VPNRRPSFRVEAPSATAHEAAAIATALEQFFRATAPVPAPPSDRPNPWVRTAMLEAVGREPVGLGAWGGDPHPWR